MISVIIPYYQRSPGILAKALASIVAQRDCGSRINVIVVDDASPAPASPEIALSNIAPDSVRVIVQPNGGPASARNTGLNHVLKGTRYIAFLDSDDEWTPDHLTRAVAALDSGYDFYFADHFQLGQAVSAFARAGRLELNNHPTLPRFSTGLHAYRGDMVDQIIRGNLIGTSTVVYSFELFAEQRFRIEFTNAGEDYLFWMALASAGAKIAFSSQAEAIYGKGVNIYAGSGWGSDSHLLRIHNELKYRKVTTQLLQLTALQKDHIQGCVQELRHAFASDIFHRLRHHKGISWPLIRAHFRLDPMSFFELPKHLLHSLSLRK